MSAHNYWTDRTRSRVSRRAVLRGAGLGAAGLAGAALIGCGSSSSSEATQAPAATSAAATTAAAATATAAGTPAVKRGGTYRESTITVAPHWSPFHPGADPSYVNTFRRTNYYDTLWETRDTDDPARQVHPVLAKSFETPDDQTVIVKMNTAFFHDQPKSKANDTVKARQVTAEDVVARLEFLKHPPASSNTFVSKMLTSSAVDDLTVKYEMPTPYAFFYEQNQGAAVRATEVPKEMLDETILKEDIPIGTGPMMYKTHQLGSREEQMRNPNYWRKDLPYLDGRLLTFIPDAAAGETAFRANQIDGYAFTDIRQRDSVAGDLKDKIYVVDYPTNSGMALIANIRRDPWKDERARHAVHRGVDVQKIINVVYFGDAYRAWYFSDANPQRFPIGFDAVKEWVGYDPAEAKKLLDAAKSAGAYDGRQIDFMLPVEAQTWVDGGRLAAQDLADIGFNIKPFTEVRNIYLQKAGPKDMKDMTKPSPFDLTMSVFLDYSYLKTNSGSFWNNNSLEDPEVDALVDKIGQTIDAEQRKELSHQLEIMLAKKAANFIPLLSGNLHHGYYNYVKGQDLELSRSGSTKMQTGLWLDT